MKTFLLAAAFGCIGLLGSAAASASGPDRGCLAPPGGPEKVVALQSRPQDCCTGRIECGQYLSTATVLRPDHGRRT